MRQKLFDFLLSFTFSSKFSLRMGLFFLIFFFASSSFNLTFPAILSSQQGQNPQQPTGIEVPSLQITLPIQTARIQDDEWLMNDTLTAFFGEKSSIPGTLGTTIIFAHARQGMFALLPLLQKNDTVVVQTTVKEYVYQVIERKVIDPSDITTVTTYHNGDKNYLALFTCYGINDTKRIIFFATLEKILPQTT